MKLSQDQLDYIIFNASSESERLVLKDLDLSGLEFICREFPVGADFSGSDFSNCIFYSSIIKCCTFKGCNFSGATFNNSKLFLSNFESANLSGVKFLSTRASVANFYETTNVYNAKFDHDIEVPVIKKTKGGAEVLGWFFRSGRNVWEFSRLRDSVCMTGIKDETLINLIIKNVDIFTFNEDNKMWEILHDNFIRNILPCIDSKKDVLKENEL